MGKKMGIGCGGEKMGSKIKKVFTKKKKSTVYGQCGTIPLVLHIINFMKRHLLLFHQ
jgi:hypothetical protein